MAAILWAAYFAWNNLRGIAPAIRPPSEDISRVINTTDMPLELARGFGISIYAENLGRPRVLQLDPDGNLVASLLSENKVVALPDRDQDGSADEILTIAEGLNRPHGFAFRCVNGCKLYIAEADRVAEYLYADSKASGKKTIVNLPGGGNHFTRTILFTPDNSRLLISVGSSCNVCEEADWRRAKILSASPDGTNLDVFARGLRNSVFMAIHPVTKEIWATEMGRDLLGDDLPPDEINVIKEGENYGWPICYGNNIHDAEFDKNTYIRNPCSEPFETPSYIDIPAHSAPLGLAFIPESDGWPEDYWHDLLVAFHGSWNRTEPTGYKIVRYKLDKDGTYIGVEDFISGWLQEDGTALGRPVDILVQPDGSLYISDDKAGVIYKVVRL